MNLFQRALFALSMDTFPMLVLLSALIIRRSRLVFVYIVAALILLGIVSLIAQYFFVKKNMKEEPIEIKNPVKVDYNGFEMLFWILSIAASAMKFFPGLDDRSWKYVVILSYAVNMLIVIRNEKISNNMVFTVLNWRLFEFTCGGRKITLLTKRRSTMSIQKARKCFDGLYIDLKKY